MEFQIPRSGRMAAGKLDSPGGAGTMNNLVKYRWFFPFFHAATLIGPPAARVAGLRLSSGRVKGLSFGRAW